MTKLAKTLNNFHCEVAHQGILYTPKLSAPQGAVHNAESPRWAHVKTKQSQHCSAYWRAFSVFKKLDTKILPRIMLKKKKLNLTQCCNSTHRTQGLYADKILQSIWLLLAPVVQRVDSTYIIHQIT